MKKLKLFILLLFFLIVTLIIGGTLLNSFAANNLIVLSGYAKDEAGNCKANIKVEAISKDGANKVETTTDLNGFYSMKAKRDEYTIKFNYSSVATEFEAKDITQIKGSGSYEGKLEIAVVYNTNLQGNVTSIGNGIKQILTDSNNLRLIENSYSDDVMLINQIEALELDTNNEHAFHKTGKKGWKSIAIIITNKSPEQIQAFTSLKFSKDYKFIIAKEDVSVEQVKKAIGELLKIEIDKEESIYDSDDSTQVMAKSKPIIMNTDTIVNLYLKKNGNSSSIDFLDDFNSTYIEGKITAENKSNIDQMIVTLEKVGTNDKARTITDDNGNYSFKCPTEGTYRIKFEFETSDLNGQEYEVAQNYTNINDTTNKEENSVNPGNSNIKEIKNKYLKIDYKIEEDLNKNPPKLEAWTDDFYVEKFEKEEKIDETTGEGTGQFDYNYDEIGKKYAGIVLKEREKFKLEVSECVTQFKIILSDGQVIADWSKNSGNSVTNVTTPKNGDTYIATLDDEIRYGATMYIEYEITVKNIGNIKCEGFSFLTSLDLMYNPNQEFLSKPGKNGDDGWKVIEYEKLGDIVNKTYDANSSSEPKTIYLQKEETEALDTGQEKKYNVAASKILDENCKYVSETEIFEYKNNEGRRNFDISNNHIEAGNYWQNGFINGFKEADTGVSQTVLILPPFSESFNFNKIVIIIYIITLIIFCILLKYNRTNKRRKRKCQTKKKRE